MKKSIVWICVILVIGIIVGATVTFFVCERWFGVGNSRYNIGKSFNFVVSDDERIDADTLNQLLDTNQDYPLRLLPQADIEKLVEFLRRNQFKIAPGDYVLNQTYGFEQILETLRFRETETDP